MRTSEASARIPGSYEIYLRVELDDCNRIHAVEAQSRGAYWFLVKVKKYLSKIQKGTRLEELPLPAGNDAFGLLMREAILKTKGQWNNSAENEIICTCFKVSSRTIDNAILAGAHTLRSISEATSAGHKCTKCHGPVLEILNRRLTSH